MTSSLTSDTDQVRAHAPARAAARRPGLLLRVAGAGAAAADMILAAVGERAVGWHLNRVRARASADPRWAQIERRRRDPGQPNRVTAPEGLGEDSWQVQQGIAQALTPDPLWLSGAYRLTRGPLSSVVGRAKHRRQRRRMGWDARALWALDTHLAGTLSQQLAHFADTAHGWPSGPEFPEFTDWQDALYTQAAALAAYARRDELSEEDEASAVRAGQGAMRWVADHLPSLWD
jgi:hypothetical protein